MTYSEKEFYEKRTENASIGGKMLFGLVYNGWTKWDWTPFAAMRAMGKGEFI